MYQVSLARNWNISKPYLFTFSQRILFSLRSLIFARIIGFDWAYFMCLMSNLSDCVTCILALPKCWRAIHLVRTILLQTNSITILLSKLLVLIFSIKLPVPLFKPCLRLLRMYLKFLSKLFPCIINSWIFLIPKHIMGQTFDSLLYPSTIHTFVNSW